jgi:excisionase family DNA binding protein
MNTTEKFLTLADVGTRLQIGRTSVYKAILEGGLRRMKFGKVVRVKESDLLAWIERHTTGGESVGGGNGEGGAA